MHFWKVAEALRHKVITFQRSPHFFRPENMIFAELLEQNDQLFCESGSKVEIHDETIISMNAFHTRNRLEIVTSRIYGTLSNGII